VDLHQAGIAAAQIPYAQVERFEGSHHLPMLDEPGQFNRTVLDPVMR
jgi:pimeloyl-ACP methyl ester carboxylesterase